MVRKLLLLTTLMSSLACSRPGSKDEASIITIQAPRAQDQISKTGGVGAMSVMPSNRKACYAVVVTASDINNTGGGCLPTLGLHAGFVEPGGTLQLEVPRGVNRKIELYAYLQNVGVDVACPSFPIGFSPSEITKTYLVGSVSNVNMNSETTEVDITASFPGIANNIAAQLAMPASCTGVASGSSAPGFHVSSASGLSGNVGTGVKLIGRVGKGVPETVLSSGDGHKLIVK